MSALPHRPSVSSHAAVRARRRALLLFMLLAVPLIQGAWANGVAPEETATPAPNARWWLDLDDLLAPYNLATEVPVMALSEDGHILVAGTDNGAVHFINATTGRLVESAEASDHGAVVSIRLDRQGELAAVRFADGYIAVVSRHPVADRPLFSMYAEAGAPENEQGRLAAALSTNGRFLVVVGNSVRLYHRADRADAPFERVAEDARQIGPFLWFHRSLPAFGALGPDGAVVLYSYSASNLRAEGGRNIGGGAPVVALAVSGDGNRFAVADQTGQVRRYTPSLDPESPQLIPDYAGNVNGRPGGLALDADGERILAWSGRELLWAAGCNQNEQLCGGRTTAETTVRQRPPFGTGFAAVSPTPDLSRVVARIDGEHQSRIVYNLPGLEDLTLQSTVQRAGASVVAAGGTVVYLADGARIGAHEVTAEQLPPPDGRGDGAGAGDLLGLSAEVLLYGGIGFLALLVLVVLVAVLLAARRAAARPPPPVSSLATESVTEEGPVTPLDTPMALGPMPGQTRVVAPSAPPTAPAPDGLLVLRAVTTPGRRVPLHGLDLAVHRPEVLLVRGEGEALASFAALLAGDAPFGGELAVGGASARETPILFQRRVRVGLGALDGTGSAAEAFAAAAHERGLPPGLVARRLDRDLGWMGDRLHRPVPALRPLDRWKVRLARALVDRPHVLVLTTEELPLSGEIEQRADTLRRVLSGVAKRYETLVVLLDDGLHPRGMLRMLADEEVSLTAGGLSERTVLEAGRPVAPRARGRRGAVRGRSDRV